MTLVTSPCRKLDGARAILTVLLHPALYRCLTSHPYLEVRHRSEAAKVPRRKLGLYRGELSRPTFASLILPISGIFWPAQPQPSRFVDLPDADQPCFLGPGQSGVELGSLPICLLFGRTVRGGGAGIESLSGKLFIDHSHSRSARWDWLLYPLLCQQRFQNTLEPQHGGALILPTATRRPWIIQHIRCRLRRPSRRPIYDHSADRITVLVLLRGFHKAECERVFLSLLATPMLTNCQPGVGDAAAELLIPQAGQDNISRTLLRGCPAGAGFQVLAKVIDAQDEALHLLCDRLQHVHDGLADRIVVLVAGPAITRTGNNSVDRYQPKRQPELRLYGRLSLPRHGDQLFDRTFVQQE